MTQWADAKKFLFEGIVTAVILILFSLSFDWLYNLSVATGITHSDLHPYSFGFLQWAGLLLGSIQLVRYLMFWKYWK